MLIYRTYKVHYINPGVRELIEYYSSEMTDREIANMAKEELLACDYIYTRVVCYKADPYSDGRYYPYYEYYRKEREGGFSND